MGWREAFKRAASLADRGDVTVIRSAASSQNAKLRQLPPQGAVMTAKLLRVARIELCRRIEFGMA